MLHFYLLFKVDFTLLLRNLRKFLDYWNALTCKYLIAPQVIAFFTVQLHYNVVHTYVHQNRTTGEQEGLSSF